MGKTEPEQIGRIIERELPWLMPRPVAKNGRLRQSRGHLSRVLPERCPRATTRHRLFRPDT